MFASWRCAPVRRSFALQTFAMRNAMNAATGANSHENRSFGEWNAFFAFRRRFKAAKRLCGIPGAAACIPLNYWLLSSPLIDPTTATIFGADPIVFVGVSTVLAAAVGYWASSSLPSLYIKTFKRALAFEFNARQGDFYRRIVKHRANVPADPSRITSSIDLYGEKIHSVTDYKRWLRMHHAIKRNRVFNV